MAEHFITLKIDNNDGLHPDGVRGKDLGDLLKGIEDLARAAAREDIKRDALERDKHFVSLVEIKESSSVYLFSVSSDALRPVIQSIVDLASQGLWGQFPEMVLDAFGDITKVLGRYKAWGRLSTRSSDSVALIPEGFIVPQRTKLRGGTTIYGQVLKVGGENPTVDLRHHASGAILPCRTSREVAIELSDYLYKAVSLTGQATWGGTSLAIDSFEIESWRPFSVVPPSKAFAELREKYGQYFDEIQDVDAWVALQREGEQE